MSKAEVSFEDGKVIIMETDSDLLDDLIKKHGKIMEARPVTDDIGY